MLILYVEEKSRYSAPVNVFNNIPLISNFKNYFIGAALEAESDLVQKSNLNVIFFSCAFSLVLLIPYLIINLVKTEINFNQLITICGSIVFYISSLFYMRWKKSVQGPAQIIITFSALIFAIDLLVYPDFDALVNGLHLAINIVFCQNMLGKRWRILTVLFHVFVIGLSMFLTAYEIENPYSKNIIQTNFEKSLASFALLFIFISLIILYRNAHQQASDQLLKSLRDLEEAKTVAEEMNQLKSRFLANMSHEIRTPLNGVLGINEILKETITDDEVREYLEIQHKSGYRLLNTIDGILNLSRLEVNKEYFKLQIIDLVQVIREVADNQRVIAELQNIRLIQNIKTDFAIVNVDETITYQAISNIINNAIKFTNSGGTVEIRLEKLPTRTILLSVIDTGIGISPDYLNRIFEPFERETTHHTAKHTGTGLGLSITQKFVELMGGNIAVESELGKGTTFKMSLPCAESNQKI